MTEQRIGIVLSEDLPAFTDFLLWFTAHHATTCEGDVSHTLCADLDGAHFDSYSCLSCPMEFSMTVPKVVGRADPYIFAVTPASLVREFVP